MSRDPRCRETANGAIVHVMACACKAHLSHVPSCQCVDCKPPSAQAPLAPGGERFTVFVEVSCTIEARDYYIARERAEMYKQTLIDLLRAAGNEPEARVLSVERKQ